MNASVTDSEDDDLVPNRRGDPGDLAWQAEKVKVGDFEGLLGHWERRRRRLRMLGVPNADDGPTSRGGGGDGEVFREGARPSVQRKEKEKGKTGGQGR
jgi:hypothetical protein